MNKRVKRIKRKKAIRKKLFGNNVIPRMSVFRSNKYIYVQIIDDVEMKTLCSSSSLLSKLTGIKAAEEVGNSIAKVAKIKKINKVLFDRNGYKFHGLVKAVADSARAGGLIF